MRGTKGIGMHKHGTCGSRNGMGKSPKLRLALKMAAEKNTRKPKSSTCTHDNITDLMRDSA